ncbi:MAG: TIGR00159 family protein [Gemmatimonadetes bacterium]|nr:TIGR00159 family protein [Gemmatimonadota bacterium]MYA64715.1 TIGR00159 family protein [Gemmatimonadota bacterium]MYB97384.1 TIGR00159 family protein [Gemmatimonadota bacterium]MYH53070.1 TIGR00159 family protein [Gemmatimonadota bacterium]MYI47435.1 TIGR00159 family protein [Gemmatimonadota bacterium]
MCVLPTRRHLGGSAGEIATGFRTVDPSGCCYRTGVMNGFLQQLQFLRPGWNDLVEIVIVFLLVYRLLLLIRETRAMQMLLGVLLLAGLYLISVILDLSLIRRLIEAIFQYGAIAALVVFQPEMRAALARLGQTRLVRMLGSTPQARIVDRLVEGAEQLSRSGVGAILAVQRETGLREYAQTGRSVEGVLSPELLGTIFAPNSPLHDGAVIIVGDSIQAAGAILPLTQNPIGDRTLGTRHRAAIGLSEETDAIVIVVSEETSRISVAYRGRIESGVTSERLREMLEASLPQSAAGGLGTPPLEAV